MKEFDFEFNSEDSNPNAVGLLDKKGTYAVDCVGIKNKPSNDGGGDQIEMTFHVVAAVEKECQDQVGREFKQWFSNPQDVADNRKTSTINAIIRTWIAFGGYTEEQWKLDVAAKKPIRPSLGFCLGKRAIFSMKMTMGDDGTTIKYRNIDRSAPITAPTFKPFYDRFKSIEQTPLMADKEEEEADQGGEW